MKKEGSRKKPTFEERKKGLVRVHPSHPGHRLTRRVNRVWMGFCTGRYFTLPGPVQPLDQSKFNN